MAKYQSKVDKVTSYKDEFMRWKDVLKPYHQRFANNYRRYTAYSDTKGTHAKISDPTAPEMVERVIQRLFERDPKFFADAKGHNLPKPVKDIMSNVAEFIWNNPDMVRSTGTMRSKLKVSGREFVVTGQTYTETYWNHIADTPDFRVIPVEDLIFDPTKTPKTSRVKYLYQFVDLDYLEDNVEVKEGGKVVAGLFDSSALKKLKRILKEKEYKTKGIQPDPSDSIVNRSGADLQNYVDKLTLVTRWEDNKCCRFIWQDDLEEPVVVQEFTNKIIDADPIQVAMDIEVPKQPYAFSFIDFLNPMFTAKDMFLNQLVDYGSKVLNPPLFIDPSIGPVNLKTVANAWKLGGVVFSPPQQAEHKPMPSLGNFGFEMLNYIQQRSEQVSGVGAYLGGVPNQASDKTQGTKGGIQALMAQAVYPVKDRQINLEESLIEPFINKAVRMVASTMTDNEFKWILITGQSPKWLKVTKGLLSGKIKLLDLLTSEIIDEEEMQDISNSMMAEGKDPEKDLVFDVDWFVGVETGSMAEVDQEKDLEAFDGWVQFCLQSGIQLDIKKVADERAMRSGIKDAEQYYLEQEPGMHEMPDGTMMPDAEMPMGQPMGQPMQPPMQPPMI